MIMWPFSTKKTIAKSGILEGFRECHCHLLPGVDDGVKKMEDTLSILQQWEAAGVREVWFTPHVMEDYPNTPAQLQEVFQEVLDVYEGGIQLHLAAENMMDNIFPERLEKRELLPIFGDHLLVETSYFNPPLRMGETLENIRKAGYRPILAHPERYYYMEMEDYPRWKARGIKFQLNFASLVGAYGPDVRKKAEALLEKGLYDFMGSDTHSVGFVEWYMKGKLSGKVIDALKEIPGRSRE